MSNKLIFFNQPINQLNLLDGVAKIFKVKSVPGDLLSVAYHNRDKNLSKNKNSVRISKNIDWDFHTLNSETV